MICKGDETLRIATEKKGCDTICHGLVTNRNAKESLRYDTQGRCTERQSAAVEKHGGVMLRRGTAEKRNYWQRQRTAWTRPDQRKTPDGERPSGADARGLPKDGPIITRKGVICKMKEKEIRRTVRDLLHVLGGAGLALGATCLAQSEPEQALVVLILTALVGVIILWEVSE